ncbi:MAG: hypothetical protein DI535_17225 [Citrobacter freundii]|nr:MAG: hypothetical protein DI535_17225 [Citrobacter freundii]
MKKTLIVFIAALCTITVFSGCKKIFDYLDNDPTADFTDCQIKEISFAKTGYKGVVTYNKDGNPVSVIYPYTSTERPNFKFKYDNKKRLIESIEYYDNATIERWARYKYNSQGLIISDTVYVGGILINGNPVVDDATELRVEEFGYDAEKRIISVVTHWPKFPSEGETEVAWVYDSANNRQPDGTPWTYDNKMNLHRTHKVFMFIDRDYSRNNPVGATSYNSNYLPTQFETTINSFLRTNLSGSAVTYKCK